MKLIALITLSLVLVTSCSASGGSGGAVGGDVKNIVIDQGYGMPAPTKTWMSPVIPIEISYYRPGVVAPWYITIHYGPTHSERYTSITGNNTDDFAVLTYPLYENDIEFVQSVISSYGNDTPTITSYDAKTQTLYLDGLARNQQRTLEIWYSHSTPAQFKLQCKLPNIPGSGYEMPPGSICEWVTVANPNPVLQPFETKDIRVTFRMPPRSIAPDKFEFRIATSHKVIGGAPVQLPIVYEATIRVSMAT